MVPSASVSEEAANHTFGYREHMARPVESYRHACRKNTLAMRGVPVAPALTRLRRAPTIPPQGRDSGRSAVVGE